MRPEVNESVIKDAKKFLRQKDAGILSTLHAINDEIYPFGSMTPYVFTLEGEIAILISDIAVHTKNIKADNHACITVHDYEATNKQAASRISVVGKINKIEDEAKKSAVSERYLNFFPEAKSYWNAHDFHFYTLRPEKVHYVQTFGKIFTFDGALLTDTMPEWFEGRHSVLEHMNSDHKNALEKYAANIPDIDTSEVKLTEIDQYGFHLKFGRGQIHYFEFDNKAHTSNDLRKEFTALAKR